MPPVAECTARLTVQERLIPLLDIRRRFGRPQHQAESQVHSLVGTNEVPQDEEVAEVHLAAVGARGEPVGEPVAALESEQVLEQQHQGRLLEYMLDFVLQPIA
jgi:hypothetical protein